MSKEFLETFNKQHLAVEQIDEPSTWILEKKRKSSINPSNVWDHFKIFTNNRLQHFAICNYCKVPYSRKSHSNLSNHINNKHKDIAQHQHKNALEEEIQKLSSGINTSEKNIVQQGIRNFLIKDNNNNPSTHMVDYFISFMLAANISFNILELKEFSELISFVRKNPNVSLPCYKTVKNRMLELETATQKTICTDIKDIPIAITHDGGKSNNDYNIDTITGNVYINILTS